jgi:hypothetical protein
MKAGVAASVLPEMPVITDEFRIANYFEAALWGVVALMAVAFAIRKGGHARSRCAILAIAMLAFGLSDVVETRTGAWWRPWWLLAWKAACVGVFVALLGGHYRRRFRRAAR